ncbi:MAG: hypothetical protein IPM51_10530 [Sphingobacteriaceae bacterium]|nr:hypothetical protein [Sphingobacteriaceae bacterium]
MKLIKIKIQVLLMVSFFIITSCKKEYNCVCSTPLKETSTSIKETKKKAKEKCKEIESELKNTDVSFQCVIQ